MGSFIVLLPFAIVALACPLMMLFMMRGKHGGHGEQSAHSCHAGGDAAEGAGVGDQTTARLREMEREVEALRREVAARRTARYRLGTRGRP